MKTKTKAILGTVIFTIYLGSCATPPTSVDLETARNIFVDYKSYTRLNDTLQKSNTHGDKFVFTSINPTGIEAWKAKKFPFPEGSVAVKTGHGSSEADAPVEVIWFMKKMSDGFDRENGNWYYGQMDAEGKATMKGGKLSTCISCHTGAKDKDYIFGFTSK